MGDLVSQRASSHVSPGSPGNHGSFGLALGFFIAGVALQLQQSHLWSAWFYGLIAFPGLPLLGCQTVNRQKIPATSGAFALVVAAVLATAFGFGMTGLRAT